MRRVILLVLGASATGCLYPHPPPPPPPPELGRPPAACEATVFPPDPRIAAAMADTLAGRYLRGAESLAVTRREHRLLVSRPGFATRQIKTADFQSGQWHDACGARYAFTPPAGGSPARLRITDANGSVTDWHRPDL